VIASSNQPVRLLLSVILNTSVINVLYTLHTRLLKLICPNRAAWWVEIATVKPCCIYYFGPFDTKAEAKAAQLGYVQDLHQEAAHGISVSVKRCQPTELTIFDEAGKRD
jgi:hypothetical protein